MMFRANDDAGKGWTGGRRARTTRWTHNRVRTTLKFHAKDQELFKWLVGQKKGPNVGPTRSIEDTAKRIEDLHPHRLDATKAIIRCDCQSAAMWHR